MRRRQKKIPKPDGLTLPSDLKKEKAAGGKSPKLFRRLRVVAEEKTEGGHYPPFRDLYLESSHCPLMRTGGELAENGEIIYRPPETDLMNCGVPIARVADIIRFFEAAGVPVIFEPPGNMKGELSPGKNGQRPLFE